MSFATDIHHGGDALRAAGPHLVYSRRKPSARILAPALPARLPRAVKHAPRYISLGRRHLRSTSSVAISCAIIRPAVLPALPDVITRIEFLHGMVCRFGDGFLAAVRTVQAPASDACHHLRRSAGCGHVVSGRDASLTAPSAVAPSATAPSARRVPTPVVPIDRVRPVGPSVKGPSRLRPFFNGDATPTIFIDDDGEKIDLLSPPPKVRVRGLVRAGHSRSDSRRHAQSPDASDASADNIAPLRQGEHPPRPPVTLSAGVGAIFSPDLWPVDLSDAPRLPNRGQCRNPNFVCAEPPLTNRAGGFAPYCFECAGAFLARPNDRCFVGQLVERAQRAKAREEKKDARILMLRQVHARMPMREAAE